MTEQKEALKPCPFCGGDRVASFHHIVSGIPDSWHVECLADECGNGTCHHETEAQAIAAWNTRADEAELATLRAKLAEAREALVSARHEMRRSINNIMGIETEAMGGDNLAVSLCSYFERHDEEVSEDGWTPSATKAYEEIREAIVAKFAPSERIFDHALTGGDND